MNITSSTSLSIMSASGSPTATATRASQSVLKSLSNTLNASMTKSSTENVRLACAARQGPFLIAYTDGDIGGGSVVDAVDVPVVQDMTMRTGFALNISLAPDSGVLFSVDGLGAEALLHAGLRAVRLCDSRQLVVAVFSVFSSKPQILSIGVREPNFFVPALASVCSLAIELPSYLFHCSVNSTSQRTFVIDVDSSSDRVELSAPAALLSFFVLSSAVGHAVPEAQVFAMSTFSLCMVNDRRQTDLQLHQRLISPFASSTGAINGLASSVIALAVLWALAGLGVSVLKMVLHVPWSRAALWLYFPGVPLYASTLLAPSVALNTFRLWLQLDWQLSESSASRPTAVFLIVVGMLLTAAVGIVLGAVSTAVISAAGRTTIDVDELHFCEGRVFCEVRRRMSLKTNSRLDGVVKLVAPQVSWRPLSTSILLGPLFTGLLPADAMFVVASWAQTTCLSYLYAIPATRGSGQCAAIHFLSLAINLAVLTMTVWCLPHASFALSGAHIGAQLVLVGSSVFSVAFVLDESYAAQVGLDPATVGFCSMFSIVLVVVALCRTALWFLGERVPWGAEFVREGANGVGGGAIGVQLPVFVTVALEEEFLKS